jgi:D-cysteine desulfhydrase
MAKLPAGAPRAVAMKEGAAPSSQLQAQQLLRAQLPRLELGQFPTPLERCPGLAPGSVELWVLREDLAGRPASGAGGGGRYGGNKLRKLELVLAAPRLADSLGEAERIGGQVGGQIGGQVGGQIGGQIGGQTGGQIGGAEDPGQGRPATLLTYGGYGSHHVLATALCAQPRGHHVAAILTPQPLMAWSRKTLRALRHSGATLLFARHLVEVPALVLRARLSLPRPVIELPPGGSSPLGVLAWAQGGREIAARVASGSCPRFDAVYVALGSGGMAAGLLLGLGDAAAELVAVRAVPWPLSSGARVRWLARGARGFLLRAARASSAPASVGPRSLDLDLREIGPMPRLRVEGGQVGPGYGAATAAALDAVARAAAIGLRLEPTYTGKTLAALLADAASGRLGGKRVLFVHSASSIDPPLLGQAEAAVPAWLGKREREMARDDARADDEAG